LISPIGNLPGEYTDKFSRDICQENFAGDMQKLKTQQYKI
jgi:hypothetical protein